MFFTKIKTVKQYILTKLILIVGRTTNVLKTLLIAKKHVLQDVQKRIFITNVINNRKH